VSETIDSTPTIDETPARRLVRPDDGRWLGGVAAGLGRYFDVNPLVYRIAFAALAFAGGTGILLYVAAWLVIPSERRRESIAVEALREHRDRPWVLLGVGLLLIGAVLALSEANFWPDSGNVWLAAVLAGAALVWWHLARRDDESPATGAAVSSEADTTPSAPRAPRKPSLLAPVLGALLAAAGLFGLLAVLDVYSIEVDLALAAAVAVVGAAVAIGAFTGHRVGALVLVGLVLLGGFAVAASVPVSVSAGTGDKLERPLDAAALQSSYEFGIGDYTVDLSAVELELGETHVDVSLGIGDLLVRVPEDAALVIDAHAGAGDVVVLGDGDDGLGADRNVNLPGPTADAPVLVLDADVGLGMVEVTRG
jgi:phage shock protein PspC (stress-responsive transcriptional regulator)